ncbi:ABC-2 family transporter protein, partial [Dysosmobacter welbionis]
LQPLDLCLDALPQQPVYCRHVRAVPEPLIHLLLQGRFRFTALAHSVEACLQNLAEPVLHHLPVQVRQRLHRPAALLQLLHKAHLIQALGRHLKALFPGRVHLIPPGQIRHLQRGIPPGLRPAQPIPAQPERLPHGFPHLLQRVPPAAQADGGLDIPEQVPLIFDLLADFGEALRHFHRMIGPQVQQHCDPGMAQRGRELLRQQA